MTRLVQNTTNLSECIATLVVINTTLAKLFVFVKLHDGFRFFVQLFRLYTVRHRLQAQVVDDLQGEEDF